MKPLPILGRFALVLSLAANVSVHGAGFSPGENNTCNAGLMNITCSSWDSMNFNTLNLVTIPCGVCVEITGNANITLVGGIDIVGRLRIAPPADTKVKITTRAVLVQGVLSIATPYYPSVMNLTTGESATVNFVMTSNGTVFKFNPFGINANACSGGPCDAGERPIVVAGGRLDIWGLPDDCATWTQLENVTTAPVHDRRVAAPTFLAPASGCSLTFMDQDFEAPITNWYGHYLSLFYVKQDVARGKYFEVTNRKLNYQGLGLNLDNTTCVVAGQLYLFTVYIKLHSNNGVQSNCAKNGTNCPYIGINRRACVQDSCPHQHTPIVQTNKGVIQGDDAWYPVTGTINFTQALVSPDNYYRYLYIDGPEAGIDIAVDNFVIKRLDPTYFQGNTCSELVVNGDAEMHDIHPYPLRPNDPWSAALTVRQETSGNRYFKLTNRKTNWSTLRFDVPSTCLKDSVKYQVSLKVRAGIATQFNPRVVYVTKNVNGTDVWTEASIAKCVTVPGNWTPCIGTVTINPIMLKAYDIFLDVPFSSDASTDMDFDDIKFSFVQGPVDKFIVKTDGISSCWRPGSKVLLTSDTMHFEHASNATIQSVQPIGDGLAAISFNETMTPRTSRVDGFPIELALMNRNIKFESDSSISNKGGHLMVFMTGSVMQHLEGVELFRFGQRGNLGRYPIHFHLCDSVMEGTIVKKNFIHQSNQRCVVCHGTHNLTVQENVAYNTFGHCYMLEDGGEINNKFLRNLGAFQRNVADTELVRAGETDTHSSTYWCTNPINTWIGNVAAGGEGSGFWFELNDSVKAPSVAVVPGPMNKLPLTKFMDNIAHSYRSAGLRSYPRGYQPIVRARFENTFSYRNWENGVFIHNSWNLGLYGGVIADNRRQIQIHRADNIRVENVNIIGQTPSHQAALRRAGGWSHCPSSWSSLYGITIHSFLLDPNNPSGPTFKNVSFSNIDDSSGCANTTAIYIHEDEVRPHFDSWTLFDGTNFSNVGRKFSTCRAAEQGLKDVIIEVTDNRFGESPGFIISANQSELIQFLPPNACSPLERSCALFCPGTCLRTVSLYTEPTVSANMVLRVQSGSTTIDVRGAISGKDPTNAVSYRTFSAMLPAGQYNMSFVENQVQVWPTMVLEKMGTQPVCWNGTLTYSISKPPVPNGFCDTLISNTVKNGNFEAGLAYWHHWWQGLNITVGGFNSSSAVTTNTAGSFSVGQYLDTRCMVVGQEYQVIAKFRIVNGTSGTVICDPNSNSAPSQCPTATLFSEYTNATSAALITNWVRVAQAPVTISTDTWRTIHGVFTVTGQMAASTRLFLYIEGGGPFIWVDDVYVTKLNRTGLPVILNGDFDVYGDHRFWVRGWNEPLSMQTPGADGTAAAIRTQKIGQSIQQVISSKSLIAGKRYLFSAKYKLDGGVGMCQPEVWWSATACPKVVITSSFTNSSLNEWKGYQFAVAPYKANNWNLMWGYMTATVPQSSAETVIFSVGNGPTDTKIILDSVSLTVSPPSCNQLLVNGGAETGDARGWLPWQSGVISISSNGTTGNALTISKRTQYWMGLRQSLDVRCMVMGTKYRITGQVKTMNETSAQGYACTIGTLWGNNACPIIGIEAVQRNGASSVYLMATNEKTSAWVGTAFNAYTATFNVTAAMASAVEVNFYMERPPTNISITIDDFKVTKI